MIILSGVLVVVAIALLVAGIVAGTGEGAQVLGLEALTVIYISIAVSIVSALCLAVGVFLRRKELFGTATRSPKPAAKPAKVKRGTKGEKAVPAAAAKAAPGGKPAAAGSAAQEGGRKDAQDVKSATGSDDQPTVVLPLHPAEVPEEALVWVVRGRKRYHLETCRQLAGKDKEDLTYVEAKEEGFSPCTACLPDTALAARAAVSAPASKGEDTDDQGTAGKAAGKGPAGTGTGDTAKIAKPPAAAASATPPAAPAKPTLTDQPLPTGATRPQPKSATPAPSTAPKPEAKAKAPQSAPVPPTATPAEEPNGKATSSLVQSAAAPSAPRPRRADDPGSEGGPQVRILSGTKRYHRADCALIEDIGDEADDLESLPRAEAKARGCTPCLVCQPDKEHARD